MKLKHLLVQPRCIGCGERFLPKNQEVFCPHCVSRWEILKHECRTDQYGIPVRAVDSHNGIRRYPAIYCAYYFPGNKRLVSSGLIFALKNSRDKRIAEFCADELARLIRESVLPSVFAAGRPVVLTWIPRKPEKIAKLGFDHMERVCRRTAEKLSLPCQPLFERRHGSSEQKRLGFIARADNVRSALRLHGEVLPENALVLLLDDVITTGASMSAAADLLAEVLPESASGGMAVFPVTLCAAKRNI